MLGLIVKILFEIILIARAIDSKLKNNSEQAIYCMLWALFVAVIFNA